jgi:hypothetical protein
MRSALRLTLILFLFRLCRACPEQGTRTAAGAIRQFMRFQARNGTVALAPTTPMEVVEHALVNIEKVRTSPQAAEPAVLGAHLEGPFIYSGKLGAQRDITRKGDADLTLLLADMCRNVAPEMTDGVQVIVAFAVRDAASPAASWANCAPLCHHGHKPAAGGRRRQVGSDYTLWWNRFGRMLAAEPRRKRATRLPQCMAWTRFSYAQESFCSPTQTSDRY